MWVDRFLQLAEWGFNVPLFLRNPSTYYGHGTYQRLKEHFHRAETLCMLGVRKDGKRTLFIQSKPLGTIFVETVALEPKWDIIVVEDVKVEFSGYALFCEDGSGEYHLPTKGIFKKHFSAIELIEDVKLRCLIREVGRVREKLQKELLVQFTWARKFCGVNHSRLIIIDYLVI